LKDDAKEAAIKKLASEALKTQGVVEPSDAADENGTSDRKVADNRAKETEVADAVATETGAPGGTQEEDQDGEKKVVDNRKLVYEDIWDDVPSLSAGKKAPRSQSQAVGSQGVVEDAADSSEVFLPWAMGNVAGMDSVQPSSQALEKRVAELRAKAGADVGASGKPGWYSKYAEKAQEQKKEAPASGCSQPAAGPGGELDEMD